MENKEDVLNVKYSREEMSKIKKIGYKEGFNSKLDEIHQNIIILKDDLIKEKDKCTNKLPNCPICVSLNYCLGAIEVYLEEKIKEMRK